MPIIYLYKWTQIIITNPIKSETNKWSYGGAILCISFQEYNNLWACSSQWKEVQGLVSKKKIKMGQSSACSDMADTLLITWPYVSPLYFTKLGVHWEYATVAGESAQAFVCFMEAERRSWRTAQHADHRLWMHLFILSMRRPDPRRRPSPSKRYMVCMFHVGASMRVCMFNQ